MDLQTLGYKVRPSIWSRLLMFLTSDHSSLWRPLTNNNTPLRTNPHNKQWINNHAISPFCTKWSYTQSLKIVHPTCLCLCRAESSHRTVSLVCGVVQHSRIHFSPSIQWLVKAFSSTFFPFVYPRFSWSYHSLLLQTRRGLARQAIVRSSLSLKRKPSDSTLNGRAAKRVARDTVSPLGPIHSTFWQNSWDSEVYTFYQMNLCTTFFPLSTNSTFQLCSLLINSSHLLHALSMSYGAGLHQVK